MKSFAFILAINFSLLSASLRAAEDPEKPAPEVKMLEKWFVGKWKGETTFVESPFGPAKKMIGEAEGRVVLGGFFVELRQKGVEESKGEAELQKADWQSMALFGWDKLKSEYQQAWFAADGSFCLGVKRDKDDGVDLKLTIESEKCVFTWTQEAKGKKYKMRQTATMTADGNRFKEETLYSEDGVTWKLYHSDQSTRISK